MNTGPKITVDFVTRQVTSPTTILAPVGGDLMVFVSFTGISVGVQGAISPTLTNLSLAIKELDFGDVLAASDGWQLISGSSPHQYVLHVPLTGSPLNQALQDAMTQKGAPLSVIAEIEWQMANPFATNFGPANITTRSLTFPITYSTAAYGTTALAGNAGEGATSGSSSASSGASSTPSLTASPLGQTLINETSTAAFLSALGVSSFAQSLLAASTRTAINSLLAPSFSASTNINLYSGLVGFWNFAGSNPASYPSDNSGIAVGGGVLTLSSGSGTTSGTIVAGLNQPNAISFPNIGNGLFMPAGKLPAITAYSICVWVKLNVAGAAPIIINLGIGDTSVGVGLNLHLDSSNHINAATQGGAISNTSVDFSDGNWHFVMVSFNTAGCFLTVDNGITTFGALTPPASLGHYTFIIVEYTADGLIGDGISRGVTLSNLGIFSRTPSGQEQAQLYNNGTGFSYPF